MPQIQPIRTRDGCWVSIEIVPEGGLFSSRWLYRLAPVFNLNGLNSRGWLDRRPWTVLVEIDRVDDSKPTVTRLAAAGREDAERVTSQILERVRSGVPADDLLS